MGTKETIQLIIRTAVRLFNESGTQAVTTNHIARAAGISPGNLYYHFKNKEAIIRAIFGRMVEEMNTAWQPPVDRPPQLGDLNDMLTKILCLLWGYRFFQRELVALLHRDTELRQHYSAIRSQRWNEMNGFFRALASQGVLRQPEDATMGALLKIGWLVCEHWISHLDIDGRDVDQESVREGVELLVHLWRPYLTDGALADVRLKFSKEEK